MENLNCLYCLFGQARNFLTLRAEPVQKRKNSIGCEHKPTWMETVLSFVFHPSSIPVSASQEEDPFVRFLTYFAFCNQCTALRSQKQASQKNLPQGRKKRHLASLSQQFVDYVSVYIC